MLRLVVVLLVLSMIAWLLIFGFKGFFKETTWQMILRWILAIVIALATLTLGLLLQP